MIGVSRENRSPQYLSDQERGRGLNPSLAIDDRGNSRIGGPHHRHPVFNRTEYRIGKVLVGSGASSKPGVIGNIHEKFGPLLHVPPRKPRKDDLKADEDPEAPPGQGHDFGSLAGKKFANPRHHLPHKRQERPQGNVFSKGDQLYLVISAKQGPCIRNKISAVFQSPFTANVLD